MKNEAKLVRKILNIALLAAMLQSGVEPAAAASPAVVGQHRFFGRLESGRGLVLALRLRSGRLLVVDAGAAFAGGRVSEPLFAGKPTVVEGAFGPDGRFHAVAVKRAAPSVANWGSDR